ncbi:hypothetical protein [Curtobacterium sp. MCBD17_040]|uniref:hypothetical protein n=1 Tax=Curtobacterium sp. MCBD17_040 TaxID=2175674 RepID=UPI000DA88558|nr:hypothetical protein [Curtobacterium sp. MCBD17_040]WIB65292.1 hypothetical protein DEI94_17965 [Curtobacterium sp. MCBD17_040]
MIIDVRGNLHDGGTGRFTGHHRDGDDVSLRSPESAALVASSAATRRLAEQLNDVQRLLAAGDDEGIAEAYDILGRVSGGLKVARAEVAREHIGRIVRAEFPNATVLELSNWGSSSEPAFVPTAVRDDTGTVYWNSDDRGPGARADQWVFDITVPLYDIDENTVIIDPDDFRDHTRNGIRLI